jgi:hypothetical protein
VENAEALLAGCGSVDVDLAQLERIDGAGSVLLARFLDRLPAGDPRELRDESKIPFVHNFFTRSAPSMSAHKGG